jgi:RHS repeat-associated protein
MRRLLCLGIVLWTCAPASASTLYRVTLTLYPGDDAITIAQQVAATYGGTIGDRPDHGRTTFTVVLSDATATLAARDSRVESLVVVANADATWILGTYTYDGSGNIRQIGSDHFRYDLDGRLVYGDAGTDAKQSYTYDGFGNILAIHTQEPGANTESRIAVDPATNQIDNPGPGFNVVGQHDLAGNLTSYNGTTVLSYDALNVVRDANIPGVTARRVFLYTASDERIASISMLGNTVSETEWTLRDADGKVLRRVSRTPTGPWRWEQDYVYRGGQLLAAEVADNRKTLRFHLDHLGTPRLITANGGVEVGRPRYFPFGQEVRVTADSEPMKFTGHERDGRSLDYMHARYYDPLMGRFLSVDPVLNVKAAIPNPQMWNRYTYVRDNPLNKIDPTGAYEWDVHLALTYQLARAAGFSDAQAWKIGEAAQYVDYDPNTQPFASRPARERYHFTSQTRRSQLWGVFESIAGYADKTGALTALGVFMHAQQDSFSHAGFNPGTGHVHAGHAPDKTATDPAKALAMAADTYKQLNAAADKLGISKDNRVAWKQIRGAVIAFNLARTEEEKRVALGRLYQAINDGRHP